MESVLIIGSSGFVGKNLYKDLSKKGYRIKGISKTDSEYTDFKCDLENESDLDSLLDSMSPDCVIFTAKLRGGVDFYEENKTLAERVHIQPSKKIAKWTKSNSRKLIVMSTDYVYSGEGGSYNDWSQKTPINFYGHVMLEMERLTGGIDPRRLVLRPTVIFGYDPTGINYLMQLLRAEKPIKVPIDQISNPTDIKVLTDLVDLSIKADLSGEFIATGPESMSRYDFSLKVAKVFGIDDKLFLPCKTQDIAGIARKPLNNQTDSSRLTKLLRYDLPSVEDSLIRIKNEIER